MRHALIRDGVVEQVVLLKEGSKWQPPAGCIVFACDDSVQIGATRDGNEFKNPDPKPSAPEDSVVQNGLTDSDLQTLKELVAKVTK